MTTEIPPKEPGAFTLTAEALIDDTNPYNLLSWTASSGATSYDVYRDGSHYYDLTTLGTTFENTEVTEGATYTYFIRATNAQGTTDSNTVTVQTMVEGEEPDVPARVKGIDVRDDIDWSQVVDSGYKFAYIKATEGIDWSKPGFEKRVEDARYAGLLVGVYHFARPVPNQYESINEAESFVRLAGDYLKEGYLRPILDLEDSDYYGEYPEQLGKETLAQWIKVWMDTVKAETHVEPILYMNRYLFQFLSDSSISNMYDIWIADIREVEPTASDEPNTVGWNKWAFWQYKQNVNLAGGLADLNIFNGDTSKLNDFVIRANQSPTVAGIGQFASDGTIAIAEGGSTDESTVIFKGTVSDPDGDAVKLEIELREATQLFTDTPTPETISELVSSGSRVTITRYGLVSGDYHWQARAVDESGLASEWVEFGITDNTDFIVSIPDIGYAVIVAGDDSSVFNIEGISSNANTAYRALRALGFGDDRIFYLNGDRPQDIDGDGDDEVDQISSLSEFQNVMEQWVPARVGEHSPFILYLVGHGTTETLWFSDTEYVSPSILDPWLGELPSGTQMLIVIDSCYSGSFITDPSGEISAPNRVIVTSAGDNAESDTILFAGSLFSQEFWQRIGQGQNVKDAFLGATDDANLIGMLGGKFWDPWIDDNGDAVGHSPLFLGDDGYFAATMIIGVPEGPPSVGEGAPSPQVFTDCYDRNGGTSILGYPINNVHRWGNGYIQDLRGGEGYEGAIMQLDDTSSAYAVYGSIWARYLTLGGAKGPLGYPLNDESPLPLSSISSAECLYNNFQGGSVVHHATEAQAGLTVFLGHGIYNKWKELGYGGGFLGLPSSDEREAPQSGAAGFDTTGVVCDFEGGHLYWHRTGALDNQAFETHGSIDNVYTHIEGSASWLGFPVKDEYNNAFGYPQSDFEGGYITTTDGVSYQAFSYATGRRQQLIEAINEFEEVIIISIEENTWNVAESYAYVAVASNMAPWWAELSRLALDVINDVVGVVNMVVSFFTPEGSAQVFEDPSKLEEVINALIESKDPLANVATIQGFNGLFYNIDNYNLFFVAANKVEEVAYQEYQVNEDYSRATNVAWNELWIPSTLNGLFIPLRIGSPVKLGSRSSDAKWVSGARAVNNEVRALFDEFTAELPDLLPDDYPLEANLEYLTILSQNIRNAQSMGGEAFQSFTFKDVRGEDVVDRWISFGMVSDGRDASDLLFDACEGTQDVNYKSSLWSTGGTVLSIVDYSVPGKLPKRLVKGITDVYDVVDIIQLPSETVNLLEKPVPPLEALSLHAVKMNGDLVHELSNLWTLSSETVDYLRYGLEVVSPNSPPSTWITEKNIIESDVAGFYDVSVSWDGYDEEDTVLEYSFILEGYDTIWSTWTTLKIQDYSNLGAGQYTFKVKSRDGSGDEDASPATYTFSLGEEEESDYIESEWVYSPNYFEAERGSGDINLIVIHTMQGSLEGSVSWFQNPSSEVSSHYLVGDDGELVQMVKEKDTAWHAASYNSESIGIEHEGYTWDSTWPTESMYLASAKLVRSLGLKYGIPMDRGHIVGHNELYSRPDPGVYWDWDHYMDLIQDSDLPNGVTQHDIYLESQEANYASDNKGQIRFASSLYSLPYVFQITDGSYSVDYTPGLNFEFVGWETEGSIYVSNEYGKSTTATISGYGTLRAVYQTTDDSPDTTITFGPNDEIDYSDVSFIWTGSDDVTRVSNLVYSYMLDGYETSWSGWTSSTSKEYNGLPNGVYIFNVKAKDEAGHEDPTPAERTFRVDVTLPTVIVHSPTGTNASVDTTITVTFSEAMDKVSAENAFYVFPSVLGSFSWNENTMTFTPSSNLATSTIYDIMVDTFAEDLAGNPIPASYTWQFKTTRANDLIISGQERVVIENTEYIQTGNILVNETGTLILRNATLILTQPASHQYDIRFYDNSYFESINSTIIGTESSEGGYYMFMYDNSIANISESTFEYPAVLLDARGDNVIVEIQNSNIDYINIGSNSIVNINNTIIDVHIWSTPANVTISNSPQIDLMIQFTRNASADLSLQPGYHDSWDLRRDESISNMDLDLTVFNSTIQSWDLYSWEDPSIHLQNSTLSSVTMRSNSRLTANNTIISRRLSAQDNASMVFRDSSIVRDVSASDSSLIEFINTTLLQTGSISVSDAAEIYHGWYLDLTVLSVGQPLEGVTVSAFHSEDGSLCDESVTGLDGLARLVLWERRTNVTGTYLYGNYSIRASLDDQTGEASLNISESREVSLELSTIHSEWNVSLSVDVGGSSALNATFGMKEGATSGFDDTIGDLLLPPGFAGVESYFYYPDNPSSPVNLRKLYASYLPIEYPANWTFIVHTFTGASGETTLFWNALDIADIPSDYIVNIDTPTGSVNMRETIQYTWTADVETMYTFTITVTSEVEFTLELRAGWNMVSLPVVPSDASASSIMDGAGFYQLVTWSGSGYLTASEFEAGRGYWLLVLSDVNVTVSGTPVESMNLSLSPGWSMVGGTLDEVQAADVFLGFYQLVTWTGSGYIPATVFEPGKGYWALVLWETQIQLPPA